jgi:hypothetical protein
MSLVRIVVGSSVALLAMATAGATAASAQSANINATANVLQPLTVTGTNNLAFGNVYPGVNKSIAYSDATNAGKFSVTGYGGAQVSVGFTLPTTLNGPSSSTLPIDSWTGYYNTTNSATSGGSTFTPSASVVTTNLSGSGGTGSLFVFVGARVSPTGTQTAGAYTNTVTMTVAYTGL